MEKNYDDKPMARDAQVLLISRTNIQPIALVVYYT
jgi:hypothetical protein